MSEVETTTLETEAQETVAAAEGNDESPVTAVEGEASGSTGELGQDASADSEAGASEELEE